MDNLKRALEYLNSLTVEEVDMKLEKIYSKLFNEKKEILENSFASNYVDNNYISENRNIFYSKDNKAKGNMLKNKILIDAA